MNKPIATLDALPDGTYIFSGPYETSIHHPMRSDNGFDWVSPAEYGFEVWPTGGGCEAWGRNFVLADGTAVYMLITDADGYPTVDVGEPMLMGVYETDGEGFINWTQDDGALEDCPRRDIVCSGWHHE